VQTIEEVHSLNNGVYAGDHADWLVVYITYRDADVLIDSNFDAIEKFLREKCPDDVEIERSRDSLFGWRDHLIVRPNSDAVEWAEDCHRQLENYAIFDETAYAEEEADRHRYHWHYWDSWSENDECSLCSIFAERLAEFKRNKKAVWARDYLRRVFKMRCIDG